MTDRLSLANAKIERWERIATEIFDTIHDRVATKADVQAVKADVQRVGARIDLSEQRLDARIDLVERRLVTRLGSLIVIVAGVLFAAHSYFPPAH
jgi:hypothetical protein